MRYRVMGSTGMNVSTITLGCWVMGGDAWWGSDHDDRRYVNTIEYAIEQGINIIDTATGYGEGHSEELVGKAIRGKRDRLIISSKANAEYLTPELAEKTVEASLKRLGIDEIDIYYIHWPNSDISVARNMEALEKLRRRGLVRFIGVSNFIVRHMDIARSAGVIDVFQPAYSLLWRNVEKELLPYCVKNGIGVMTYSSMAMGLLSGKYTRETKLESGDIRNVKVPLFSGDTYLKALDAVEKLKAIAARNHVTVAQAAVNWVISQGGVSSAIVGARTPEQLKETLAAAEITIPKEDLDIMAAACDEVKMRVMDWDTMFYKKAESLEIKE